MPRLLKWALWALSLSLLITPTTSEGREPTEEEAQVIAQLVKRQARVNTDKKLDGWRLSMWEAPDPAGTLELLAKLPREEFRELNFADAKVTDEMLGILPEFSQVHTLNISRTLCTPQVFSHVVKMPELTQLKLGEEFTDEGLEQLIRCKKLSLLDLYRCLITPEGMKQIGKLTGLRELSISQIYQMDEGLSHLTGLTELTKLELKLTDCTDAGLAHLASMKKLKWLVVWSDQISDEGLKHLAGLTEIEHLGIASKTLTDAALTHLAGFPKLKVFSLGNSQATEAGRTKMQQMYPDANISIIIPKQQVLRRPPMNPNLSPQLAKALAERQVLMAQDLRPARFLLPGYAMVPGKDDKNWKQAHIFLHMSTVYQPPANAGPALKFTVIQPGYVGLAASWEDEGPLTDELRAQRKSLGQLVSDGWTLVGYADRLKSDDSLDRHYLLTRKFVAGEKYEVLTRLNTAPFLLGLSQQAASAGLGFIPETATISTLEKLPPRDPLAGRAEHDLVMVTAQEDPTPALPLGNGYLLGEISRQAIQLSARHELSLPTMDTASGVKFPHDSAPKNRPLEVVVLAMPETLEITVLRSQGDKLKLAWKYWYRMAGDDLYEQLVERMEHESRTQLVEELYSAGFKGKPYSKADAGEVDEKAATLMSEMDFVAQFAAIQILHTQIQTEGESPERISALSRAYANLSLLCEFSHTPARIAWQARSLLYAQRLQAVWPNSPLGDATRAYAWALVGRHQTALAAMAKMEAAGQALPSWLVPVAAFCKFDQPTMEKLTGDASVGALTRVLMLEGTLGYRDDAYVLQAADRVLETTPDCYRAIMEIWSYHSLGTRRRGAALYARSLNDHLLERLAALKYLPDKLAASLPKLSFELKTEEETGAFSHLIRLLPAIRELRSSAGQPAPQAIGNGAPGNDVLAAMLDDLVYVDILWQLATQKMSFGVPVDDELNAILPHIKDYWLSPTIACLYSDERLVNEAREIAKQRMQPADAIEAWFGLWDLLQFKVHPYFKTIKDTCSHHEDITLYDLRRDGSQPIRPQENYFPSFVRNMQLVAPHMPATIAWRVETDPAFTVEQGKEFARQYKDSAPVLYALGDRFAFEKQFDLAELCWKRFNRLVKSPEGWEHLAELYLEQGDEQHWLDSMEQALQQPAYGLEHAAINEELARHFMGKRDFRRALPYALHSAESYSGFGLLIAAACHEAMQD